MLVELHNVWVGKICGEGGFNQLPNLGHLCFQAALGFVRLLYDLHEHTSCFRVLKALDIVTVRKSSSFRLFKHTMHKTLTRDGYMLGVQQNWVQVGYKAS